MIQKLQSFFHTETKFGRFLFIVVLYAFFWLVFYGTWLIMPERWFEGSNQDWETLFFVYIFILVPIVSFKIPKFLNRTFSFNKRKLYVAHVLVLLLMVMLFLSIAVLQALNNLNLGGF